MRRKSSLQIIFEGHGTPKLRLGFCPTPAGILSNLTSRIGTASKPYWHQSSKRWPNAEYFVYRIGSSSVKDYFLSSIFCVPHHPRECRRCIGSGRFIFFHW